MDSTLNNMLITNLSMFITNVYLYTHKKKRWNLIPRPNSFITKEERTEGMKMANECEQPL